MLVRCESCQRTYVRKDEADGRCPRCGAVEGAQEPAGAAATADPPSAVLVEGSAPGAPTGPGKRRRGTIPKPPPRLVAGRPAFEDPGRPLLRRFFGTAVDVVLRPAGFFTHLSRDGARGVSWFAFTCLLVGHAGAAAWQLALGLPTAERVVDAMRAALPRDLPADELQQALARLATLDAQIAYAAPIAWLKLLLAPLTAYFALHLLSGLVHVGARAFSTTPAERVRYDTTYRAFCYATAPMLLAALPGVSFLAVPWTLVVLSLAIAKLHHLRLFGVLGGVLLPAFFLSTMWSTALGTVAPAAAELLGIHMPPPLPAASTP